MTTEFVINGTPYTVNLTNFPPDITLNTFIREHAQLTATKFMCLEGGCGACICVVKGKHPVSGKMRTWSVNSCLTLLNTCAGWEIITDEGIGNKHIGYHPIQKRLAKMNGTQCGFCSPGFVMNMYALLESKGGKVTMAEVENSFGGNICRCTGYRPILDAMKSFAVDSTIDVPEQCRDIEDFEFINCPKTGLQCAGSCHKRLTSLVYADGTQWFWPRSLSELFDALSKIGIDEFMLVAGNTAHGVYRRSLELKHYIDMNAVSELKQHAITNDKLTLGGNLTLTEAMEIFLVAAEKSGFEYCQQLWQHFDLIANVPVRNVWIDWKATVRKKIAHNNSEARATGGGPYNKCVLTSTEEKIGQICGIFKVVEGIENTREFGQQENEEESSNDENERSSVLTTPSIPNVSSTPKRRREPSFNECIKNYMGEKSNAMTSMAEDLKKISEGKENVRAIKDIKYELKELNCQFKKFNENVVSSVEEKKRHHLKIEKIREGELEIKRRKLELQEIAIDILSEKKKAEM